MTRVFLKARHYLCTRPMELKKIEETRSLVRQATKLLRTHLQTTPYAPLSSGDQAALRTTLCLLQPCLSILRTFEEQPVQRILYATVGRAVGQVIACTAAPPTTTIRHERGSDRNAPQTRLLPERCSPPAAISAHPASNTVSPVNEGGSGTVLPSPPCVPSPRWKDMYGCTEAILALRQATTLPLQYPALFTGPRTPWRRLLLYGPPGTGKTQLAAATAAELGAVFLSISAADVLSKWVGESEKQVRLAFTQAAAVTAAPHSVLFFDEVDALCSARGGAGESELARRLKTEFLLHLQTVAPPVTVLAATNLPWELDAAIVRRFDRFIYVGLPNTQDKLRFVSHALRNVAHSMTEQQLQEVVEQTEHFSLVDVRRLVSHAVMAPVTEWLQSHSLLEANPLHDDAEEKPVILTPRNGASGMVSATRTTTLRCWHAERVTDAADPEEVLGGEETSGSPSSEAGEQADRHDGSCPFAETSQSDSVSSAEAVDDTVVPPVQMRHFVSALRCVAATVSAAELARYAGWSSNAATA